MKNLKSEPFKVFLFALALLSFSSRGATAYAPQFADDAGMVRLRWKTATIPISVSASFLKGNPNIKTDGGDTAGEALRKSLDAWERAANVKFEILASDKQSVSPAGKFGDGASLITAAPTPENLLLFSGDTEEIAARTKTFFNGKGAITEADIVLNPYQQFSTDGSIGTFDLQSTLTHEIGHLLGLGHSPLAGATMFERQGKNGIYGLPNFAERTLSEDDVAGARALYGAKGDNFDCCGAIGGKLSVVGAKNRKDVQIWAEDAETGRIAAAVLTNADGAFRIEGLNAGKYSLYAQDYGEKKNAAVQAQTFGAVEVGKNKTVVISKKIKLAAKTFDARLVGFNAQLSDVAVPLNAGKSFTIYVGGKNLDAENFTVGFDSPFFSVAPNSLNCQEFDGETSSLSFEVKVSPNAPAGEYSLYVKSKAGEIVYLSGVLTVENFLNPWSVSVFSADE